MTFSSTFLTFHSLSVLTTFTPLFYTHFSYLSLRRDRQATLNTYVLESSVPYAEDCRVLITHHLYARTTFFDLHNILQTPTLLSTVFPTNPTIYRHIDKMREVISVSQMLRVSSCRRSTDCLGSRRSSRCVELYPTELTTGVQIGNACWELYTIEHGLSVST